MGRPRRQEGRRAQLVAAARLIMVRDGLVGLRVREVAKEAGVSPASVLYYYPDSFSLAVEALTEAALEAQTERAAVAASVPDPRARVNGLLDLELHEDALGLWRALSELPGLIPAHPELRELLGDIMADQVHSYAGALHDGVTSGAFRADLNVYAAARSIAAGLHWSAASRWCQAETLVESREAMHKLVDELVSDRSQARLPHSSPQSTPQSSPRSTLRPAAAPAP